MTSSPLSVDMENVATLWDKCVPFLWDNTLADGIEKFLQSRGAKTVLDASGGTGFPSLELKKRGWDIAYSDGSQDMHDLFVRKMQARGLDMPHYCLKWQDLSQGIRQRFDAVLARGNSLVYVDSWSESDPQAVQERTFANLLTSLREFRKMLNDGGFLYTDLINKSECDRPSYPAVTEFGEREVSRQKVSLRWEITPDYEKRLRIWKCLMTVDNVPHQFTGYSYPLRHEELVELLYQAGFSAVQETPIEGETHYPVYVANK